MGRGVAKPSAELCVWREGLGEMDGGMVEKLSPTLTALG